jgi:hypothetical protein
MADEDIFQPRINDRVAALRKRHVEILQGMGVMKYFVKEIFCKIDDPIRDFYKSTVPEVMQDGDEFYGKRLPFIMALACIIFEEQFCMDMEQYERFHKKRITPFRNFTRNRVMNYFNSAKNWYMISRL